MESFRYGTGYIQSKLDGTEQKFETTLFEIPKEFSHVSTMTPVEDQGSSSMCVCYTLSSILDWMVNRLKPNNNGTSNKFDKDKLYNSRSDKSQDGMQIKEALHFLRHIGLDGHKIQQYAMIGSIELAKRAIIMYGPIAIGLKCYDTYNDEFWRGSSLVGGHAVTLIGYNEEGFILRNSWGKNWHDHGHILFPYIDFSLVTEAWVLI